MPIKKKAASKAKSVCKSKTKIEKKGGVLSSRSHSLSPKQQSVARKTSPPKISTIADELRLKILESVFKFSDTLDNRTRMEGYKYNKLRKFKNNEDNIGSFKYDK